MNYIQKLLNGQKVEWKTLGEVAELKRGKTITAQSRIDGNIPVISGGQQPAYYNADFNRDGETITVAGSGAYAGHILFWNEPIFVSDAFSVKPDLSILSTKYVYYFLTNNQREIYNLKKGAGIPHVYPKDLAVLKIPIPPLSVQKETVRILDKFTELQKELQKELQLRKKQYIFYRDKLLNFEGKDVTWKTIKEIGKVRRGKRLTKSLLSQDEKYAVFHGGLEPLGYYGESNRKANTVMVINVGASAGTVGFSKIDFWSSDGCFCIEHSNNINSRFLYFYLLTRQDFLRSKVRIAGIPTLDNAIVENLLIPIPPLAEQERIVSILDKFDTLVNSISEGLPKEIELRKKQYEYYRDMLLNFNS